MSLSLREPSERVPQLLKTTLRDWGSRAVAASGRRPACGVGFRYSLLTLAIGSAPRGGRLLRSKALLSVRGDPERRPMAYARRCFARGSHETSDRRATR